MVKYTFDSTTKYDDLKFERCLADYNDYNKVLALNQVCQYFWPRWPYVLRAEKAQECNLPDTDFNQNGEFPEDFADILFKFTEGQPTFLKCKFNETFNFRQEWFDGLGVKFCTGYLERLLTGEGVCYTFNMNSFNEVFTNIS